MTLDRLTDEIVEWEAQRTATQSPPDRREIREQLHDVDLPALDERGVIGFNSDEGMVGRYDGEHEETATPGVDDETGERTDSWQSTLVSNRRLTVAGAVLVTVSLTVTTAAVLDPVVAAGVFGGAAAVLTAGMAAYRLS